MKKVYPAILVGLFLLAVLSAPLPGDTGNVILANNHDAGAFNWAHLMTDMLDEIIAGFGSMGLWRF